MGKGSGSSAGRGPLPLTVSDGGHTGREGVLTQAEREWLVTNTALRDSLLGPGFDTIVMFDKVRDKLCGGDEKRAERLIDEAIAEGLLEKHEVIVWRSSADGEGVDQHVAISSLVVTDKGFELAHETKERRRQEKLNQAVAKLQKIAAEQQERFQDLTPEAKSVFLYLGEYDNYGHTGFACQADLMEALGLTLGSVRKAVKELLEADLLEKSLFYDGKSRTVTYQLTWLGEVANAAVKNCLDERTHWLVERIPRKVLE